MADVFVSYQHQDKLLAEAVVAALRQARYSVWWDTRLTPAESWDATIQNEIDAAKVVLVLWSARSVGSEWVRSEADYAKEHGKLIPVTLGACSLPLAFRLRQTADLSLWAGEADHPEWLKTLGWIAALTGVSAANPETSSSAAAEIKAGPVNAPPQASASAALQENAEQQRKRRARRWRFLAYFAPYDVLATVVGLPMAVPFLPAAWQTEFLRSPLFGEMMKTVVDIVSPTGIARAEFLAIGLMALGAYFSVSALSYVGTGEMDSDDDVAANFVVVAAFEALAWGPTWIAWWVAVFIAAALPTPLFLVLMTIPAVLFFVLLKVVAEIDLRGLIVRLFALATIAAATTYAVAVWLGLDKHIELLPGSMGL